MTELALHVLLSLGDGPAHGYAIGKDIETRTGGRLDPATGSLYQVIKRLTDDGLIRPAQAPQAEGDTRRKYFALTAAGRQTASAEIRRLEAIVQVGRQRQLYKAGAR
jgi:DNA-binding PadR family transcriptional regulator